MVVLGTFDVWYRYKNTKNPRKDVSEKAKLVHEKAAPDEMMYQK